MNSEQNLLGNEALSARCGSSEMTMLLVSGSWASLEVNSWTVREANPSSSEGEPADKKNKTCERNGVR